MSVMPPESRAFRRELIWAAAAFLVVWLGLTAGSVYLFWKHLWSDEGWLSVVTLLRLMMYSVLGGTASATGVWWLVNAWNFWRGYYLCPHCGRPRKRKGHCNCLAVQKLCGAMPRPVRRRSVWRHYRKRIPSILLAYAAVIPAAIVFALKANRPAGESLVLTFLVLHAALCALLGIIFELCMDILGLFGRGRRLRKRSRIYIVMFASWAIVMISIMFFKSLLGA